MGAKAALAALLACAGCTTEGPTTEDHDSGWPVIGIRGGPEAGAIAGACNAAEGRPDYARLTSPDATFLSYVARDPVCTTDRRRRGRAQCSFELGEARITLRTKLGPAAGRVRHWWLARASFSYRRVGAEHEWVESWYADSPCRP